MVERQVSGQEIAPLRFSDDCEFVLGTKRAAIYDLRSGNVYSLNEEGKNIILGETEDKYDFLPKLKKLELLETSCFLSPETNIEIPRI